MDRLPLRCPCKEKVRLINDQLNWRCSKETCAHHHRKNAFTQNADVPILISSINTDTVCEPSKADSYVVRDQNQGSWLKKHLSPNNGVTRKNCSKFIDLLLSETENPKVLIIGGGSKGVGTQELWENKDIEVHSIDIYASPTVDLVCDAHYLPLEGEYYNAVWIQAVLEHVVQPDLVVNEIHRVLKQEGIVYAETPFMQQVHEGAYDFTRYTVLGHRYLFKRFSLIDMGGNGGAGISLAWALKYFVWALFRSKTLARVTGALGTLLLRPFERLFSRKSLFDSSSGVFFLGKKMQHHSVSHKDLISLYRGQQN
tara:strand:- start:1126 stop:2061 length:936 start_codon:yes stop_codon:yes gene_type:complete